MLGIAAVAFIACSKDECKDISCQNGGKCNDGTCQCEKGFTGSKCENTDVPYFLTRTTWKWSKIQVMGKDQPLDSLYQAARITFKADGNAEVLEGISGEKLPFKWRYDASKKQLVSIYEGSPEKATNLIRISANEMVTQDSLYYEIFIPA